MATPKLKAQAGKLNMVIEQGTTFSPVLEYRDSLGALIDLTGFTARMQIRAVKTDTTTLEELTTENVGSSVITLGDALGTITLLFTATETAAMVWSVGVYDLELESAGGIVTRLLTGSVVVDTETTR